MHKLYAAMLGSLLLLGYQQGSTVSANVVGHGSLPPLPQLYECVQRLDKAPYDAARSRACLASILASGYFENGHIDVKSGNSKVFLDFVLTAPSLVIKGLKFEVNEPLRKRMLDWMARSNGGMPINVDQGYEASRDDRTVELMNMFFWDAGRRAGITKDVWLNYKARTATVSYQVTLGPGMIPQQIVGSPGRPQCKPPAQGFNLTDVDDYVPVNLVEKMTKTYGFACFTARDMAEDRRWLEGSKLFREASYEVRDGEVMVRLRGRELTIKAVRVVGYGLLGKELAADSGLPLKAGHVYRRSEASAALNYLRAKYSEPEEVTRSYEDDSVTADGELIVNLQVLAYPEDTLTINGKALQPHDRR